MYCGELKRDSSTFTCFLRAFLTHCLTQSLARCLFNVVTRRPRARLKKEELPGSAHGTQSASYLPAAPSFSPSPQVLGQMEIPSRTFDPELPRSIFPSSTQNSSSMQNQRPFDSSRSSCPVPRETRLLKNLDTIDTIS